MSPPAQRRLDTRPETAQPSTKTKQRLVDDWDEWATHAAPLELTATLVVDTTVSVDCSRLAERIRITASPIGTEHPLADSQ